MAQDEGFSSSFPSSVPPGDLPYKAGYLQKKTKAGKWQKRYFETNGVFLTYYKSKKMSRLLAAVNLPQVGAISIIDPDAERDDTRFEGLFSIQLNSREYVLRAHDQADAEEWVKVLSVLKAQPSSDAGLPAFAQQQEDAASLNEDTRQAQDTDNGHPTADFRKSRRGVCCTGANQSANSM